MTGPNRRPDVNVAPGQPFRIAAVRLCLASITAVFLALAMAVWEAGATERQHGFSAGIHEGQYWLSYFNFEDKTLDYFFSRGLQGGGYTWAGLARAGLELESSRHLYSIYFDPEGDYLFLDATNKDAVLAVIEVVARMVKDIDYREACIAHARSRGYLE